MSRTKKRKLFECIEYLSVEAPLNKVDYLEDKQSKYIREYVRNKEYMIVGTERRHGFSQGDVNRQWAKIVEMIRRGKVQGIVVANMAAVIFLPSSPSLYLSLGSTTFFTVAIISIFAISSETL